MHHLRTSHNQDWECDLSIYQYCRSLKKVDRDRIALVQYIFEKEGPWSNRSRRSLKKIEKIESLSKNVFFVCFWQFPPFLCQKSELLPSIFALRSFSRSNRSSDHKKRAIRSTNRWSNFQTCHNQQRYPLSSLLYLSFFYVLWNKRKIFLRILNSYSVRRFKAFLMLSVCDLIFVFSI